MPGLDERREESVRVVISGFNEKKAKLERDAGIADQYIGRELADTTALSKEIDTAEAMRKHLKEYQRMVSMQEEIGKLTAESEGADAQDRARAGAARRRSCRPRRSPLTA